MPELCVVDYFLWALQRYIYRKEYRFWDTIQPKIESVLDIYDISEVFNKSNPFSLEKVSAFPTIK